MLAQLGKKFNWERPEKCPKCSGCTIWGHGFTQFCPAESATPLFLKRYQCQDCRTVITLKPEGFYKKYQSPIAKIYDALIQRLTLKLWPASIPRQRGRHWLLKFIEKAKMEVALNCLPRLGEILMDFNSRSIPFFC